LCRYLHVPLQSGDDGILQAMNRRYTTKEYIAVIEKIVSRIPDIGLGTDLMVGFPGENEPEFEQTYRLVSDLPFAYFHIFSFSKRPGTAAARLHNTLDPAMVKSRSKALAELSRRKRMAFYQRYIGTRVQVLFETRSDDGLWTGLTDNYLRLAVSSPDDLTNTIREVTVTGVMDGLAIGQAPERQA
jgi:threonylcarbamoyladenosine tRNA methylthiotransferase MtaB